MTTLESAVAEQVRPAGDRGPRHPRGTYRPPYPSFTARYPESVQQVVMACFGVQDLRAGAGARRSAVRDLFDAFAEPDGPAATERAGYVDELGAPTTVGIAYWTDPASFDRWFATHGSRWTDRDRVPGLGFFAEVVRPTTARFETLFSAPRLEGVGRTAAGLSGEIEEHGYWGGMRDRIPAARVDDLPGSRTVHVLSSDGRRVRVAGGRNLCLIRSGQDVVDTGREEREFYDSQVLPALTAGMDFLRDRGRSVGCWANRFMTVLDEDLRPVDRTFGMSWWDDLASLEDWARTHPTHLAIFGAAGRHLSTFGPRTQLRLFHEVTVVDEDAQVFEYLDCHPSTGLLRALSPA